MKQCPRRLLRRCILTAPFLLPSLALAADDISAKDFDLACAMTTGAEMGVNAPGNEKRSMAFTLFVFYLGRLSGRDDSTDWNKVALGRVAELKDKARSDPLFSSCTNFYPQKSSNERPYQMNNGSGSAIWGPYLLLFLFVIAARLQAIVLPHQRERTTSKQRDLVR
jgi:hypothetical protein